MTEPSPCGGCFLCKHAECQYSQGPNGYMLVRCKADDVVREEVFPGPSCPPNAFVQAEWIDKLKGVK